VKFFSAKSFYRAPSDEKAPKEDGAFVNAQAGLFGVSDGVSAGYSPSNPPLIYPGGLTGGQVATKEFCSAGMSVSAPVDVEEFALNANSRIRRAHNVQGKDPTRGQDVGGASFAVCHFGPAKITFVIAGDCFALVKYNDSISFLTGFDQAAFKEEQEANATIAECFKQTEGDKGRAWDIYFPHFSARKVRCANKNIGKGGYALLNGDPALKKCWTVKKINCLSRPQFILLGSDGLLTSAAMNPARKEETALNVWSLYVSGGLPTILQWRDKTEDSLSHITGWPEASAVEIKLL